MTFVDPLATNDPSWCAAATRAALAYRALRAAAFLHLHDASSLPRFAATVRLAGSDMIAAFLAASRAASSAPPRLALPASLPRPLASGHARVPLTPPLRLPAAAAPSRDDSLEQAARDAKRDSYVVNGERLSGAEVGFSGVLDAALRCARAGGAPAGGALRGALGEALRRAGRTCSGADSFEAAARALGLGGNADDDAFLVADSAGAAPISVVVAPGAAVEGARAPFAAVQGVLAALREAGGAGSDGGRDDEGLPDAVAWASGVSAGLRVALRAPSAYFLVRAQGGGEPLRVARVATEWARSLLLCGGDLIDAEEAFVDVVVEML